MITEKKYNLLIQCIKETETDKKSYKPPLPPNRQSVCGGPLTWHSYNTDESFIQKHTKMSDSTDTHTNYIRSPQQLQLQEQQHLD